jgi:4-amino-4-deoxy-L-arabinose transferase-like glycosyltransferase
MTTHRKIWFLAALILLSSLLSFVNLGRWALLDSDEATYAEVYHESAVRQDFLSLTMTWKGWFDKPPLYFLLSIVPVTLFGENEFSLRAVSALLTVLSVVLVYIITLEATDELLGAELASLVLLFDAFFLYSGRQVRLDVPVTCMTLLGFLFFLKAQKSPKWYLGLGISAAASVMFKSIIGLLIYPILLVYSVIYKDIRWLKDKWFWFGSALAIALAVPWHIYEAVMFGNAFWNGYIFRNIAKRTFQKITIGSADPGPLFYIWQMVVANQPWLLFFACLGVVFFLKKYAMKEAYRHEFFAFATTLAIFVLFLLPATKLDYYFIPMLPFMAMFIGSFSATLIRRHKTGMILLLLVMFIIGSFTSFLWITATHEYSSFFQDTWTLSQHNLAQDERAVGVIAAKSQLKLYVYQWLLLPTTIYYTAANGGIGIETLDVQSHPTTPFLLLIPTSLFEQGISLPIKLESVNKVSTVFKGPLATLIRFD